MQNNPPIPSHELRTAEILIVSNDKTVDGKIIYMSFKLLYGIIYLHRQIQPYRHLTYLIHDTIEWYFKQKGIRTDKFDVVIDFDFANRSFNKEEELNEFIKTTKVPYDKLEYGRLVAEYRSFIHEQPF
jgi:hypothetical protein